MIFRDSPQPINFESLPFRPGLLILICLAIVPSFAKTHKKAADYGLGFSSEISAPESEVIEALEDVVNDGIIQGSKEYNKDKFIEKAEAATSSSLFPPWKENGKVYYKIRNHAIAPANFKETQDEGTVAVRYIVTSKDATRTIVRIDAVFVENFRHAVHASDGSVESAEFQDIQDHVDALELRKKQAEEAERHRQEELAKRAMDAKRQQETIAQASMTATPQSLEQHVAELRRQVERVVKEQGGQLKSAPFQSATSLKSLGPGTQVVILIVTPYWYGVETEDGQHGWINHSELEPVP
jgi:hypothetical protein